MNWTMKMRLASLGLRQRTLAAMAGIPEDQISNIVTGAKQPSPEQKKRICKVLGLSEGELFGNSADRVEAA